MRARRSILLAALAVQTLGLGSCISADPDPTVLVRTSGGVELGASTTYGVVFLGTTATSGEAEVVAWFGDGPELEPSLVESIGGGLYSVDVDIDLPAVPMSFDLPDTSTPLEIRGRDAAGPWVRTTRRADEPTATGLLLLVPDEPLPPASSGAGVYLRDRRGQLRLIGLLAGRVQVIDSAYPSAAPRERLAAIGPTDLWRLVSYRRNRHRPDPWVYREDLE
jgi:hypothetical protein